MQYCCKYGIAAQVKILHLNSSNVGNDHIGQQYNSNTVRTISKMNY